MKYADDVLKDDFPPGVLMIDDNWSNYPDVVKQLEALAGQYRQNLGDYLTKAEGTGRRPAGGIQCKTNIRKP